jgi:hypothetical protein
MKSSLRIVLGWLVLAGLMVTITAPTPVEAQRKGNMKQRLKKLVAKANGGWSLDEAMQQLELYPKDPYMQYVALQLARRENRVEEIAGRLQPWIESQPRDIARDRTRNVHLYSIFTGALAIQESLQLDTMRGPQGRNVARMPGLPRPAMKKAIAKGPPMPVGPEAAQDERDREAAEARRKKAMIPVPSLQGPTVKSHPWKEMLAGKKPEISALARYVPEDFYFAQFSSLNKLLDVMDSADLWTGYFNSQADKEARKQDIGERLKKQLAVETNRLLRPFYDLVVNEVAVTGSDLFVREGSDVTLVFRFKQPEVFKARMDGFLANAAKAHPDAVRTEEKYGEISYVHLATSDRAVDVYAAYPADDLHVRSNSLTAFKRILDSCRNVEGRPTSVLGNTDEFAYIRTLMPAGAKEEDGFLYLSDPFIRRLVGPELKLTERRRMLCYNQLRMIGHAALLYRTEHGRAPGSLQELADAQCSPGLFGQGELTCPDGGQYSLSADGMTGACSHHGRSGNLTPCCEILVKDITGEEGDEYKAFVQEYNQYWRTYFDPIAIRLKAAPEQYRIETIILPLIDNSIYNGLVAFLGGKPEPLDALPVPKRNIFSVAVRLDKNGLAKQLGLGDLEPPPAVTKVEPGAKAREDRVATAKCVNNLRQLVLAMHNYHDTYGRFPANAKFDKAGKKPLLSWRVLLLPFVEQQALYNEFHLDEPWDSEHNKKLIARMPAVYRCPSLKLQQPGRTSYLAPVHRDTMFTGKPEGLRITDALDGTSNTILIVESDDEHAAIWTKPDDLKYDPKQPLTGLVGHHGERIVLALADGSVHILDKNIDPKTLTALFTRAGGEVVDLPPGEAPTSYNSPDFVGIQNQMFEQLKLKEFLSRGIGNQVGLHVYDATPLFDFNLPNLLGMTMGNFSGRSPLFGGPPRESLLIAFIVASLNSPVYVGVPVQDAKVVDEFLARLDVHLAELARKREPFTPWLRFEQDYYRLPLDKEHAVRSYGVRIGPVKWRVFFGRVGNGLYVASKQFIFEDLLAMHSAGNPAAADRGPTAHGMIRARPEHWDRVLADYKLGWEENNREACLENIGPLSSLARSLHLRTTHEDGKKNSHTLQEMADRIYGTHFFCPDGGEYVLGPDGKGVVCTLHGTALAPKQSLAPGDESSPGKLLRQLKGVTIGLTFLEDGLHAVMVIDRKR